MSTRINAAVHEGGNGFPGVGDFVRGDDGEVYVVVELSTWIHTGQPGGANWCYAVVELADWSDVDDDTAPKCSCTREAQS